MRRLSLFVLLLSPCIAAPVLPGLAAAPADPAMPATVAGETPAPLSRDDVRAATAALSVAGYASGPVDGDWDEADARALGAYQADWQLPETGELDADLLLRLLREHPVTAPRWVETDTGCRVWNRYPQAGETVTWNGDCVDGATSGQGRLVWTSILRGETLVEEYAGQRSAGRENGVGIYTASDGSRYVGDWRDGLKHGSGVFVSAEGHVYVGGYQDGQRHGSGIYSRTEGSSYAGDWQNGTQGGTGTAIWPDGTRYDGLLAGGAPQGQGTLTFPDGNVYSGEWKAGCFAEGLRGASAGVTLADCGWE